MTEVCRTVNVPAKDVFAVLADGWSYAGWVVGASHIRDVDPDWPSVGSRIHHKSGPWPVQVADKTTVLAMEQDRMLELRAKLWVLGDVRIRVSLLAVSERETEVRMEEHPTGGPVSLAPKPLQDLVLKPRNQEALGRLADLADGRGGGTP
ncbi:SRPBCC family protein [Amycolatopsis palatopharyngis]|uniref:SRPBCC family protein n=1 Tax=Amycolatopsis palatopharyngis TaxID=187982 RepID=UPI000E251241|nr:SRPBCC family protein [Amycolatopsis palatopharyngis]